MPLVLNDTFTGTDGSSLVAHTSESVHTWIKWDGQSVEGLIKTYSGLSVASSAAGDARLISSAVIGTADVSITFAGTLFPVAGVGPNNLGVFARMTRLYLAGTDGNPNDGYDCYWVFFDGQAGTWYLRRYNAPASGNRNVLVELATSVINPMLLSENTTPRTFTFEVTGTGASVRCLLKEGSTTIIDFSDTSASRIVAEGKVGIHMGAYNVDNSGRMDSIQAYSIVASSPVSFSGTVPTRNGIIGTAASFANAGFFAGTATPFAYTLQAGVLPAGLTLGASTGIISGTPTTAGTTSGIVIRATDANSATADTNSYAIVIAATNASPTFPGSISNISGTAGSAITPVNVSGQFSDTDALTYSASPAGTAWPSGLIVNSSTGIISGTVAGAGTTTGMKVRATDTASQTVDSNAFNVVIAAASVQPTFTPTITGKRAASAAVRASVPCNVVVIDKVTPAIVGIKTGLTSTSLGLPPAFQLASGAVSGTEYLLIARADADNKDLGFFWCTPA